jgi:hypothetical protein
MNYWISVTNQLPEHNQLCLIYGKNVLRPGHYNAIDSSWDNYNLPGCRYTSDDVTHWIPVQDLPEVK